MRLEVTAVDFFLDLDEPFHKSVDIKEALSRGMTDLLCEEGRSTWIPSITLGGL